MKCLRRRRTRKRNMIRALCRLATGSFDGVFIWNCFEQIPNPRPTLAEYHRILRRDGVLNVRTPNGLFYELCESVLAEQDLRSSAAKFLKNAMGYNNLLGFPYMYGYSVNTLERLIKECGFKRDG